MVKGTKRAKQPPDNTGVRTRKMKRYRGVKELAAYRAGEVISNKAAILAKCADCMGQYVDGAYSCEITDCPLFPYMPYATTATSMPEPKTKKVLSEAHRAKMLAGKKKQEDAV